MCLSSVHGHPALIYLVTIVLRRAIAQIGVSQKLMVTPQFWLQIVMVYFITFSLRFCERAARWLFYPNDSMVLAEVERLVRWALCSEWSHFDANAFHNLVSFSVAWYATAGAAHHAPLTRLCGGAWGLSPYEMLDSEQWHACVACFLKFCTT